MLAPEALAAIVTPSMLRQEERRTQATAVPPGRCAPPDLGYHYRALPLGVQMLTLPNSRWMKPFPHRRPRRRWGD